MLYRFAAVMLACSLLISCNEESAFSGFSSTTTDTTTSGGGGGSSDTSTTTGGGGGGGGASQLSGIVRKTQIPMGFTLNSFDMGNSDDSISYVLDGQRLFRPDPGGQLELYTRTTTGVIATTTAGNGNKILSHTGVKDVIDYADGTTVAIGVAVSQNAYTISDAGDVVAFASNDDLTGANPTRVNQIFTLSTDGADTYNQITTFVNNHMMDSVIISGDASRIFFTSDSDVLEDGSNADGSHEVFSINSDGSSLIRLTDVNAGTIAVTRSSTDGSIIALEIVDLDGSGLGILFLEAFNTATRTLTEIAATPGTFIDYDMSADGSRAVYLGAGIIAGTTVIYAVNTSNETKTDVFTDSGVVGGLQLNANGSQVSFHSSSDLDNSMPIAADELGTQIYTGNL